jgi:hypothetical protein
MYQYLLDTSAVVQHYVKQDYRATQFVNHVFELKAGKPIATLWIPSFCIAEVFNTFAKPFYKPSDQKSALSKKRYEECLKQFREDVHRALQRQQTIFSQHSPVAFSYDRQRSVTGPAIGCTIGTPVRRDSIRLAFNPKYHFAGRSASSISIKCGSCFSPSACRIIVS